MSASPPSELDDLRNEVARLREIVSTLEHPPSLPGERHAWRDGTGGPADDREISHSWLTTLSPAGRHRRRLPRLPFEVLFLVACAVAVGLADFRPIVIAAVMGGAWLLVSLVEWSASRADRLVRLELLTRPTPTASGAEARADGDDLAWLTPPVDRTVIIDAGASETGAPSAPSGSSDGV